MELINYDISLGLSEAATYNWYSFSIKFIIKKYVALRPSLLKVTMNVYCRIICIDQGRTPYSQSYETMHYRYGLSDRKMA